MDGVCQRSRQGSSSHLFPRPPVFPPSVLVPFWVRVSWSCLTFAAFLFSGVRTQLAEVQLQHGLASRPPRAGDLLVCIPQNIKIKIVCGKNTPTKSIHSTLSSVCTKDRLTRGSFVGCNSPSLRLAGHLMFSLRAWCKQCLPGR